MSNRFCVEGKQIFGNNILPNEVLDEVRKQGVVINDDDCHFDGFIENPDDLLTAIERATLRQVNKFAKNDDDLLRISLDEERNDTYMLHEINSRDVSRHALYKQNCFCIRSNVFLQPYFAVDAMREKCFFNWDTHRLEYKESVPIEQRKILVTWG